MNDKIHQYDKMKKELRDEAQVELVDMLYKVLNRELLASNNGVLHDVVHSPLTLLIHIV